jgi:NADH dehydrogenase FAD-containing subunit
MTTPLVAIVGGGYAGIRVAKALDADARVVLIEPKDAFQHNVAALRGLVQPSRLTEIFFPYGSLLAHGTVVKDRAVSVAPGAIELAAGERLQPDYIVLATGSTYPFPAKAGHLDRADAIADYERLHGNVAAAQRILLLGAGAVGLELAGEILAQWPDKRVVLVDPAGEILPGGYDPALPAELHRQLAELNVEIRLGAALAAPLETEPGDLKTVTATLTDGSVVEADLWLRCYGTAPVTDYLGPELADARTAEGYLAVDDHLRVAGQTTVFALGDIAAIDDNKAGIARRQAEVVIANIRAAIAGSDELATYERMPPGILLPLGPERGAGYFPGRGLLDSATVSQMKGADMLIAGYKELFDV